ncbi:inter-alpha-trypsin inhibitor heavy chain family member [Anaeramoeba flamelloides]|uniref:Inter-alpha-trypsin inhibitor heavy chain family member n=1 Tax=Anaeramoeba flamelloides TaxID=1746091 RepID=A0AAV7YG97_9EUKA|nr:inter-alpha-trypsin inhibitor heavy chain family member [Anaeramoeba flamelloides]
MSFEVTSTYHDFNEDYSAIRLQITKKSEEKVTFGRENALVKHVVLVLDISGSMAGMSLKRSKKAICSMFDKLWEEQNTFTHFVTYNSVATSYRFETDLSSAKKIVRNIKASGSTNFEAAFNEINLLTKRFANKSDLSIVFFTDGQDNHDQTKGKVKINKSLEILSESISTKFSTSELHSLGFTRDHDAVLMNKITSIGSNQGIFQYISSSEEIEQCTETLSSVIINSSNLSAKLTQNGKVLQKILLENYVPEEEEEIEENEKENEKENENEKEKEKEDEDEEEDPELLLNEQNNKNNYEKYIAYLFVPIIQKNDKYHIVLTSGTINTEVLLDLQKEESINDKKQIIISFRFFRSTLMKLSERLTSPNVTKKELLVMKETVDTFDKETNKMLKSIQKFKRKDKQTLFPQCQDLKNYIIKFHELLALALTSKVLTNEQIATLNSLAYRGITKNRLKKKLDKRVQSNVDLFEKIDKTVETIVSKIDFDKLKEREKENIEYYGQCVLSTNNWIEALEDEDCLGIAIDIGRSEAAIMDPSQLQIKDIFSSMISAQAFLDACEFSLTNVKENDSKEIFVHGGFDKRISGEIVKGQAREKITGVIPLYICKEHWRIAKLKMKPVFGFMTTLDVLGYSYSQVATIPFLVLAKACQNLQSEFEKKQFKMILDTCNHVYLDTTEMKKEVVNLWNDYTLKGLLRTPDSIISNRLFVSRLLTGFANKTIEFPKSNDHIVSFLQCLVEEEFRRNQGKKIKQMSSDQINKIVYKILNVNEKKYITPRVKEFKMNLDKKKKNNDMDSTGYAENIISLLKTKGVKIIAKYDTTQGGNNNESGEEDEKDEKTKNKKKQRKKKKNRMPEDWKGVIQLNDTGKQLLEASSFTFKNRIIPILNIIKQFYNDQELEPLKLEKITDLKIDSNTKLLALLIQNLLHVKNASRRLSFEKETYVNPFEEPKKFLKRIFAEHVNNKVGKITSDYSTQLNQAGFGERARIFGETDNIYEAVGALRGAFIGENIGYFADELRIPNRPLVYEKLVILTQGHFHGIPLIYDKMKTTVNNITPWTIGKIKLHRIYRNNVKSATKEQWKKINPNFNYIIDRNLYGEWGKTEQKNEKSKK